MRWICFPWPNLRCQTDLFLFFVANYSAFEVEEDVLPNLREYGLANSLFWALAEGHACEISARRNAMDVSLYSGLPIAPLFFLCQQISDHPYLQNASKNAGEMINKYQILFNRTRQAVITGELVEIITGATASADM